jgi:RimJ/RimL family protein N-acetyltransferase
MRPEPETSSLLLVRCHALWEGLAGVPVTFIPAPQVALSPESRLSPRGWVGIVVIGDAAIATAPDASTARVFQRAISDVPSGALTDPELLHERCEIIDILGPATLAYLDPGEFRPRYGAAVRQSQDAELRQFLAAADTQDIKESGLTEITSPPFAVRHQGQIAAVAGYRHWPGQVAHLSVLTATRARGRGLGRLVASAAVEHAIHEGLLPQWRARSPGSRRIARALGFQELGSQISIRLSADQAR